MPIDVIKKPHIGVEVADIRFNVFTNYWSYFNLVNILGCTLTWGINHYYGVHFTRPIPQQVSIAYHMLNFSQINFGQEHDMLSHRKKYDSWLIKEKKSEGLILWGVSRGTAATFCAYAKEKYPEVRLVVLEGAIDSSQNILSNYLFAFCPNVYLANRIKSSINIGLSFFKNRGYISYDPDGPSPLKSVDQFPEDIPVVFITSEEDKIISCVNTERIAKALANREKNPVYLLKLKHSRHPNYMFDNSEDRNNYELFIHAIYKKYNLNHDQKLANAGQDLLNSCRIHPEKITENDTINYSLAV